ncbi:50S ribosomal protein L9 [Arthrobacter crystallopoietes]|jgi:large subunit ribosomal protein L9|uniref:Large ribosomal subunit protein bL9 n=1 Tax=Crystallibacter crystallopoietes TaxID=37928 RepID=A0A1H1D362_9MICC|nr:50S ribosomal protein L9 [Arthrobacter crystallopoietes]AUI50483.1 50S ribosomal protein L9 [Arthrobacter crystallopoietes]QTG81642.1 50S ribosomal protein L9 [Arthrobacter crystallopoietes]SDQ70870.1 LSU ribosomal protein L9P [Arthrobacter crystallopoietes]
MAKLILTHEVTGLGTAGDVVEVKNGYARNYLLPRGFALAWSKGGEKQVESIKAARAAREHASLEDAQAQAQSLSAKPVKLTVKAGESGRLFGTVKPADVAAAVEAAGLGAIDKRKVELPEHIKSVGKYQANVRLHEDVAAVIDLQVVAG